MHKRCGSIKIFWLDKYLFGKLSPKSFGAAVKLHIFYYVETCEIIGGVFKTQSKI